MNALSLSLSLSLSISPIGALTSSHSVSQQQYAADLFIALSRQSWHKPGQSTILPDPALREWFLQNGPALFNPDETEAIILGAMPH